MLYFTESWWVVFGLFLYFDITLSLGSLYVTGLRPIIKSYQQNKIIPFAINEATIATMESSMSQEISSKYFFDYLTIELRDEQGVALFALYSDLRRYMVLCDDRNCPY